MVAMETKRRSHGKSHLMDGEKYSLRPRSIAKRLEVEQKLKQPVLAKRTPKPKQKPAPLSKYRRKTANARERSRMQEINQAFETLRKAIPHFPTGGSSNYASSPSPSSSSSCGGSSAGSEKCTKITTLRLAMDYIEALTRVLDNDALLMHDDHDMDVGFCVSGLLIGDRGSLSSLGSIDSRGDLLSDDLDSFDDIPNIIEPSDVDYRCTDDDMTFDIFLQSTDHADDLHCSFHHADLVDSGPITP